MSLATRCSACGTVFRVVQDQLRVSEGWVRCGRCEEVFNGLEGLFDLDDPARTEPIATSSISPPPSIPPADQAPSPDDMRVSIGAASPSPAVIRRVPDPIGPPAVVARRPGSPGQPTLAGQGAADAFNMPLPARPSPEDDRHAAPAFIVQADSQTRWREGRARPRWVAAMAVLLLLLAGQVGFEFRGHIASRWPGLQPAAQAVCRRLGCTLPVPHQLDVLSVDGASLVREDAHGSNRLDITLRNRGPQPVAMPALELSLSDDHGQVTARRVFLAAEFSPAMPSVSASSEVSLQLPLTVNTVRVAGFAVEIFYP